MLPEIPKSGSRKFGFLFLILVAVTLAGCSPPETASSDSADAKVAGTVGLEIDFRSDKKNIEVFVPCSADSTVFSILSRAKNLGDLDFESQGSNRETRFVTSIGGVENQAAAGDNWVFRVNGELADRGCGDFAVKPGDHVQWVFGKYP